MLKHSYTTKFKCVVHHKGKSLPLKVDLLFGNTSDVAEVMLRFPQFSLKLYKKHYCMSVELVVEVICADTA